MWDELMFDFPRFQVRIPLSRGTASAWKVTSVMRRRENIWLDESSGTDPSFGRGGKISVFTNTTASISKVSGWQKLSPSRVRMQMTLCEKKLTIVWFLPKQTKRVHSSVNIFISPSIQCFRCWMSRIFGFFWVMLTRGRHCKCSLESVAKRTWRVWRWQALIVAQRSRWLRNARTKWDLPHLSCIVPVAGSSGHSRLGPSNRLGGDEATLHFNTFQPRKWKIVGVGASCHAAMYQATSGYEVCLREIQHLQVATANLNQFCSNFFWSWESSSPTFLTWLPSLGDFSHESRSCQSGPWHSCLVELSPRCRRKLSRDPMSKCSQFWANLKQKSTELCQLLMESLQYHCPRWECGSWGSRQTQRHLFLIGPTRGWNAREHRTKTRWSSSSRLTRGLLWDKWLPVLVCQHQQSTGLWPRIWTTPSWPPSSSPGSSLRNKRLAESGSPSRIWTGLGVSQDFCRGLWQQMRAGSSPMIHAQKWQICSVQPLKSHAQWRPWDPEVRRKQCLSCSLTAKVWFIWNLLTRGWSQQNGTSKSWGDSGNLCGGNAPSCGSTKGTSSSCCRTVPLHTHPIWLLNISTRLTWICCRIHPTLLTLLHVISGPFPISRRSSEVTGSSVWMIWRWRCPEHWDPSQKKPSGRLWTSWLSGIRNALMHREITLKDKAKEDLAQLETQFNVG